MSEMNGLEQSVNGLVTAAVEAPQSAIDLLTGSGDPKSANLGKAVQGLQKAPGAGDVTRTPIRVPINMSGSNAGITGGGLLNSNPDQGSINR
ncbi:hypothetical protein [Streptomyces sp. NPDC048248]|uniref:hypothetical protein n=1 Tax=Streptomyces sp. NPDC048248 TaxID=3365523 RepID=UPI00371758E9